MTTGYAQAALLAGALLGGPEPYTSSLGAKLPVMEDYAGAWSAEHGRCHRIVYSESGQPGNCPGTPVVTGWRYDANGRWYEVEACARHASELWPSPGPARSPAGH
ncbi:MAG: hypothetical protein ACP5VR_12620 [Acidimicrobiales bacterium]